MEDETGGRHSDSLSNADREEAKRKAAGEEADYHGTLLFAPECRVLQEVEGQLRKPVPRVAEVRFGNFGFAATGGHVTRLGLCGQALQSLPESIGNLTSLQELHLYDNKLTSLPASIGRLTSLQVLVFSDNKLSSLPESIGNLTSLQELILDENQLSLLPASLGNLSAFWELYLGYNKLSSLPVAIENLKSLHVLSLSGNEFSSLPETVKRVLKEMKTRGCEIEGIEI